MPEHAAAESAQSTHQGQTPTVSVPPRMSLWSTYAILLRWTLAQIGAMLPLILVVQIALAAGIIVGFGLLIPDIDPATAAFLSSGAPTILLLVIGFVMVPQGVATARTNGTFTYQRTLPVARPLLLLSELSVWLLATLPGVAVTLLVAMWRYQIDFSINWLLLIATAMLTALTAAAVGHALAVALPPLLAQLATQILVFFLMLFSPIAFPASQLPPWFQAIHDVLPFRPAADLIRAGLLSETYSASWADLATLTIWTVVGVAISIRALSRRG